ncbi:hypothetical protein [Microbacterium sp. YJN-G]|uniref:arsenate reductase/protein-tyrosine-phosphatase family protein n=1 Tax=Microbacterium sp. YJN-G TaxID=2763257 RepID=UPI001878601F|nr:hypothetical protein [Microbacterium sp. YJN-G]
MAEQPAPAPTILFVCTGNVCRSPYMEHSLRAALAELGVADLVVRSAGTRALRGHGMAPPMAERLRSRGIDTSAFRATGLGTELLETAGIVITATREHRREVVSASFDSADRTFTLAQLTRLLAADAAPYDAASADPLGTVPLGTVPGLVRAAHAAQGWMTTSASADDDLEDPWLRPRRVYRRVADRIDDLMIPLAVRLAAGA